jgi:hypothetical protein
MSGFGGLVFFGRGTVGLREKGGGYRGLCAEGTGATLRSQHRFRRRVDIVDRDRGRRRWRKLQDEISARRARGPAHGRYKRQIQDPLFQVNDS